MILTVTLNAALDLTYTVDALVPHTAHRVREVHGRAGGKGVNVARVLTALGEHAVVAGLAGGATGQAIRADLAGAGLPDETVGIAGESRRTVNVVARGDATIFNEPGPYVSAGEWRAFTGRFAALAADADVVTLSGSLPPGVPVGGYAELVRIARDVGAWTLVDTGGEPLRAALAAHPDVVTPNAAELAEAMPGADSREPGEAMPGADGREPGEAVPGAGKGGASHGRPGRASARRMVARVWPAAEALLAAGARAVVVTMGAAGMLAITGEGSWRAHPAVPVRGNPTGAGDACVAALAAGHARRVGWRDRLRDAVALSSAAVLAPVAGEVDLDAYQRFRSAVVVEEIDGSRSHT